jgi:hypothetical protein
VAQSKPATPGISAAQRPHQPVRQLEYELADRHRRTHAHGLHPETQQQHAGQQARDGIDDQRQIYYAARGSLPIKNPLCDDVSHSGHCA